MCDICNEMIELIAKCETFYFNLKIIHIFLCFVFLFSENQSFI